MMQKYQQGYTLIELIVFIVILSIFASTISLTISTTLRGRVPTHNNIIAGQLATKCMEWFVGQRDINGYDILTCPSTPAPALCSTLSGFTISSSITCTTISGDASYKTITVTVSGLGDAKLTGMIGDY